MTHNSLGLTSKDYADRAVEIAKLWGLEHANLQYCGVNALTISNYFADNDHIHIKSEHAYIYAKQMIPAIQRMANLALYY